MSPPDWLWRGGPGTARCEPFARYRRSASPRREEYGRGLERPSVGVDIDVAGISTYMAGDGKPCVVVLHEWWGLVPHIKDICDRFAAAGFTAFAPDMYDGAVAPETEPEQ